MTYPSPLASLIALVGGACLCLLSGCAATPESTADSAAAETPEAATVAASPVPTRAFPDDSFHDLLVAEFALRRNEFDIALDNYVAQAQLTRDSGVTERATRLAQFLNAEPQALSSARLWTELEPDNLEARFTLAAQLGRNQQLMEASEHMTRVLEAGGQVNFTAISANAATAPPATREALEARIDQLREQYPEQTDLMTAKALLLQQRNELEPALALAREVIEMDGDNMHAITIEARVLQQLRRSEEAVVRLEETLERHPNNRRLRLQYARILMQIDLVRAREQFSLLLHHTPNDADLLLSMGLLSKETGQPEQAETYFQRLLATEQRNSEALYYLGELAEQRADISAAIEAYQQVPPGAEFMRALNRIVAIYAGQGQLGNARDYLRSLRQTYPDQAVRLYLLECDLLLAQKLVDDAAALMSTALQEHPQNLNLLYARSMVNQERGDLAAMESDLRQIIAEEPDNATALNALGYTLATLTDRLTEAHELIRRASEASPEDPAIMDSLGWVEYRLGNLEVALTYLRRAYEKYPDHEVAAHLGEVLWQLGEREQAWTVWQEALQQRQDSKILRETMQRLAPQGLADTNGNGGAGAQDTP